MEFEADFDCPKTSVEDDMLVALLVGCDPNVSVDMELEIVDKGILVEFVLGPKTSVGFELDLKMSEELDPNISVDFALFCDDTKMSVV